MLLLISNDDRYTNQNERSITHRTAETRCDAPEGQEFGRVDERREELKGRAGGHNGSREQVGD